MDAPPVYERHATVLRVVDGDTLWLDADLGCDTRLRMSIRLYGLNCPELPTVEGKAAAAFTAAWVAQHQGWGLVLRTVKDKKEKYGRYLADLLPMDGSPSLCQSLLAAGHAVTYP